MLQKSLKSVRAINSVNYAQIVLKVAHEGYKHSPYDWWLFDARMTSPKTCELCKILDGKPYRGDWIPTQFEWHIHKAANKIKAMVHRHCRCLLWWIGRSRRIYQSPFGFLTPEEVREIWKPTKEELKRLTPSQVQEIFRFIRSPFRG